MNLSWKTLRLCHVFANCLRDLCRKWHSSPFRIHRNAFYVAFRGQLSIALPGRLKIICYRLIGNLSDFHCNVDQIVKSAGRFKPTMGLHAREHYIILLAYDGQRQRYRPVEFFLASFEIAKEIREVHNPCNVGINPTDAKSSVENHQNQLCLKEASEKYSPGAQRQRKYGTPNQDLYSTFTRLSAIKPSWPELTCPEQDLHCIRYHRRASMREDFFRARMRQTITPWQLEWAVILINLVRHTLSWSCLRQFNNRILPAQSFSTCLNNSD